MSAPPTLTPEARVLAHAQGLSRLGHEAQDGNYDGQLDAREIEATVRFADLDKSGHLNGRERRQLAKLLGGERHDADERMDEEYLASGMGGHSAQTLKDAQREVETARQKLERAKRERPKGDRPTESLDVLRARRDELEAKLTRLQDDHAAATATLEAAEQKRPAAEARLKAAQSALDRPSAQLHGLGASYDRQADDLERLSALVPNMEALPKAKRELQRRIGEDEKTLARMGAGELGPELERTKVRLSQSRSDLSQLEATERMEKLGPSKGASVGPTTASFHPSTVKARIDELRSLARRDEMRTPGREKMEQELREATREKTGLDATITQSKATIRNAERELPETRAELERTKQTLGRAEAFEAFDAATERYERALTQHGTIQSLAGIAERGEKWRRADLERVGQTKVVLGDAEAAISQLERPGAQQITRELHTLQQVEYGVYQGTLKGKDVNLSKVEADIEKRTKALEPDTKALLKATDALIAESRDPNFRASLLKMSEAEQTETLERMTKVLVRTEPGRKLIEQDIVPAMRGEAGADPFWSEVVGPKKTGRSIDRRAMAVLDGVTPVVANLKDGGRLLDDGMARALTVDARQMKHLEEAVRLKNEGDRRGADALLMKNGMAHLSPELDRISGSLLGKELALTVAEITADGRLRMAFAGPANVTSKIQLAESFCEASSRFGRLTRLCGKVTPPLNIVAGALGLNAAIDYGDIGGTVGNSLVTTGGLTAGAGLALSATVVGAPAGVICKVAGGIIAGVGYGIDLIWGDSRTEKTLKAMGLSGYLR